MFRLGCNRPVMFIGGMPDGLLHQIAKSIQFDNWSSVWVCCSGSFRVERTIRRYFPTIDIYSNDVSLLTCAVGRLAMNDPMPIRYHGALEWIEERLGADAPYRDRVAALLIAGQLARFSSGKMNTYKLRHIEHIKDGFPHLQESAREKLGKVLDGVTIQGFYPGDFRQQIARAQEAGGGVISFPPTYKGGYEALYRFIHANVEWSEPAYDVFDPATLPGIVDGIAASGMPYCILTDQPIADRQPVLEYVPGRNKTLWGYSDQGKPSYRVKAATHAEPFAFRALDVAKLHAGMEVKLVPIETPKANYIKDIYLAKHIVHSPGMANFAVFLDDMLAGLIIFALSSHHAYSPNEIYLLSDLSTTREAKVSKLIARLALSSALIGHLQRQWVRRFDLVVTTAFSKNPVSMKYRGVFDLLKRAPAADGNGFMLNYGHAPVDEAPAEIFQWWWNRYGSKTEG